MIGFERHTFYELVLNYYRARNQLSGAEHDIDVLRRESSDTVDVCWSTVDEKTTLQVCWCSALAMLYLLSSSNSNNNGNGNHNDSIQIQINDTYIVQCKH